MKSKSVKTMINQLVTKHKTIEAVAELLGISVRYAYYLKKGERKANIYLAEYIRKLINE
jgi:hypothetical protein